MTLDFKLILTVGVLPPGEVGSAKCGRPHRGGVPAKVDGLGLGGGGGGGSNGPKIVDVINVWSLSGFTVARCSTTDDLGSVKPPSLKGT